MAGHTTHLLSAVFLTGCLWGCAEETKKEPAGLTASQKTAYEQCLKDSQAVATAWEVIKQRCFEQATGQAPSLLK